MLIVGCGGLAGQMIDDIEFYYSTEVVYWTEKKAKYDFQISLKIIETDSEIINHFNSNKKFVLAIGNPIARIKLAQKFKNLGGQFSSFISPGAKISKYAVLKNGLTILSGVEVEAASCIEEGVLLNKYVLICHGTKIGSYSEVGPGSILCGDVIIGNNVSLGAGVTVIPGINIGDNSVVAAGAVVVDHIPKNTLVAGVPAVIKRSL